MLRRSTLRSTSGCGNARGPAESLPMARVPYCSVHGTPMRAMTVGIEDYVGLEGI